MTLGTDLQAIYQQLEADMAVWFPTARFYPFPPKTVPRYPAVFLSTTVSRTEEAGTLTHDGFLVTLTFVVAEKESPTSDVTATLWAMVDALGNVVQDTYAGLLMPRIVSVRSIETDAEAILAIEVEIEGLLSVDR